MSDTTLGVSLMKWVMKALLLCYYMTCYLCYQIGESWKSSDCSTTYTCAECANCSQPVGIVTEAASSCRGVETCEDIGNSNYDCVPGEN